jgi:hypothetical protein
MFALAALVSIIQFTFVAGMVRKLNAAWDEDKRDRDNDVIGCKRYILNCATNP